jgi:DNA-binding XRE family transcriptional regulator
MTLTQLTNVDMFGAPRGDAVRTSDNTEIAEPTSPVGIDHETSIRRRSASAEYRRARASLAPFEELARLVIAYRIEHDVTQEELAAAMGTSASAISRLEAGYHQPSLGTLRKFGEISGRRLVVGFEDQAGRRELVGI